MSIIEQDELSNFISYAVGIAPLSIAAEKTPVNVIAKADVVASKPIKEIKTKEAIVSVTPITSSTATVVPKDDLEANNNAKEGEEGNGESSGGEKYFDPVTGEPISKNAFKKLQKNVGKKEKKPAAVASTTTTDAANENGAPTEKKEKKEKKVKEPEVIYTDATPSGEKKILEGIFPPTYQPKYVEAAWQSWWEKCGFYQPSVDQGLKVEQKDKFIMVIPPPNVTGSLHLGHALTTAIEDTITRYNRMKGKVTLWVPGTDHAGIATQSVVEKRLKKEENITRHDLGRDEFIKRVWEWKNTYGGKITNQIRSLGASVDWSRESFTMDANLSRAVTEAFVRFHEQGLLYRDTRLINWSCALQSAISEIEVDYMDIETKTFLPVPGHKLKDKYEFGTITSFAYKVVGSESDEEIVVATTRLETMLGDTAVAVHPDDPRYTHLHGKFLQHPFVDRQIPIITDSVLVDMSFGTGAVKVTPAHDPNDYLCGKRNNLEFIVILTEDGKIVSNLKGNSNSSTTTTANGECKYSDMMRYDARLSMEKDLEGLGLYRGKENNKMRLGLCSRSGDIIEPMLTPQWYVNCTSMAEKSIQAVRQGELKIVPEFHEATWYRWLENIRDWCVSRQLWWGHRIPAYFVRIKNESPICDKNDPMNNKRWVVARSPADSMKLAILLFDNSYTEDQLILEQDEDVLDTWFSSGLFPFSVFGWPEETPDFKAFYPTSLLETGQDILFFWVARMVMMGLQLTGKLPFTSVYLHSMVRDKYGRKMSKSLGNVIDPLEVINGCALKDLLLKIEEGNLPAKEIVKAKEGQSADFPDGIPECGADALRFGLLAYTSQGRDINLDIKRVVGYRQFCNKLWNAVRFALVYVADFTPSPTTHIDVIRSPYVSKRDLFIFSRLNATIKECNLHIKEYSFGAVASALHSFFLYEVCDLYLELIKPVVNPSSATVSESTAATAAAVAPAEKPHTLTESISSFFSFGSSATAATPAAAVTSVEPATDVAVAERRRCAQATLYTVLEQFLRLCHPLMPFVTEELWQRLPHLTALTSKPSIMVSAYPEEVSGWFNPVAESDMETVKETIHAARSLRADYRIPNPMKGDFYFRSDSTEVKSALLHQQDDFCTLAKANFLSFLTNDEPTPKGCCLKVLALPSGVNITLLLNLTGMINIEQELQRLNKEVERLTPTIDQYKRKINAAGYADKVPEDVRASNAEKLATYENELATTMQAITAFEAMR